MKIISNLFTSFGKLRARPAQPRLQCKRCHRIAYTPLDRAQHAHYAPYCSDNCLQWSQLPQRKAANMEWTA